jgi:hypothetical protein
MATDYVYIHCVGSLELFLVSSPVTKAIFYDTI